MRPERLLQKKCGVTTVQITYAGTLSKTFTVNAQEPTATPTAETKATPEPVTIPLNVEGMKILKIGEGVKRIRSEAFAGTAIEVVYLPASVTNVAEDAFDNCPNLKYILNASSLTIKAPANVTVLTESSWIMTAETLKPAAATPAAIPAP